MDVLRSFKNIAGNVDAGNLIFVAALAAVGAGVSIAIEKIVKRAKSDTSAGNSAGNFTSFGQQADEPTVNFVFGTGRNPEVGAGIREPRWEEDEILTPYRSVNDEYSLSGEMVGDYKERLV